MTPKEMAAGLLLFSLTVATVMLIKHFFMHHCGHYFMHRAKHAIGKCGAALTNKDEAELMLTMHHGGKT